MKSAIFPSSWSEAHLQEICSLIIDGVHKTPNYVDKGIRFISIANIRPFRFVSEGYVRFVSKEEHEEMCKRFRPKIGDVLLTKIGTIGYAKKVDWDWDFNIFVGLALLRPKQDIILPSFLEVVLNTPEIVDKLVKGGQGSGRKTLPLKNINPVKIPIPPLKEQKRIVSKIEELFKESRIGREELDKIPEILKKFRQSVLAKALRGELVSQNSNDEPVEKLLERIKEEKTKLKIKTKEKFAKYDKLEPFNDNRKLPRGWNWIYLGALLQDARYGSSVKCEPKIKGTPVIRIPNILHGSLDFSDLKYANFGSDELQRLKLEAGDVLVCRTNGSLDLVGKSAVVENLDSIFTFASYLIRLRPIKFAINSTYLHLILESNLGRHIIEERARTTAGQYNVNLETLSSIKVPLPPFSEQKRIIEKTRELFSLASQIENSIDIAKNRAYKIDQAILTKAFRGELVPQDPNDEPASVLLERIKFEREKQLEIKQTSKNKPRKSRRI